jgi:hypothetical protein
MLWTRLEMREWTFGVSFDVDLALHIGPIKISYVPKGTQLYRDFLAMRHNNKKGGE